MSYKMISRLHAGPVHIPLNEVRVISLPEIGDKPAKVIIVYDDVKFYMSKNEDGTSNGVGYMDGVPVRLVLDKTPQYTQVWNQGREVDGKHAPDYEIVVKSYNKSLWLELQDDHSTRDTTTFWVFYVDGGILRNMPDPCYTKEEATSLIEVLQMRGDENTSAYDFECPEEAFIVQQLDHMDFACVEAEARKAMFSMPVMTLEEIEEQINQL